MIRNQSAVGNKTRRGLLSLELLFALPILLFMLLGIFEFSFLFYARGDVIEASRAGARMATLAGVQEEDIELEVRRSLGNRFGSQIRVQSRFGEFPGDEVVVAVSVPMTAAAPDLLWPIGYSIRNKSLIAETRMLKE